MLYRSTFNGSFPRSFHILKTHTSWLYTTRQNSSSDSNKLKSEIPHNVLEDFITAQHQPDFGKIYDKKPFKMSLQANKQYSWCCCGSSKTQPLCDRTHKSPYLKIKLRPVRFKVEKDGDYWLCNCKQTSNRPFCDGTHKREDIQEKIK